MVRPEMNTVLNTSFQKHCFIVIFQCVRIMAIRVLSGLTVYSLVAITRCLMCTLLLMVKCVFIFREFSQWPVTTGNSGTVWQSYIFHQGQLLISTHNSIDKASIIEKKVFYVFFIPQQLEQAVTNQIYICTAHISAVQYCGNIVKVKTVIAVLYYKLYYRLDIQAVSVIIIIMIFVYYTCSQTLQPNQQLPCRTALIQQNTKHIYTTKHNTRFSTGILSCYIYNTSARFTSMP